MNWKIVVICVFVCLVYSSKMALAGYCNQTYTCTTTCSSQYNTKEDCGWWIFNSWVKCTKQRTLYGMCTDTCYKQACCHGYGGDDCSRPICHGSEHCRNGGTCMAPDECSCTTGFSPPLCDDINECQYNNGGCSQVCTNTYGSFRCSCRPGFKLGSDGKSCIDVNECQHNNGGCSQVCTNAYGSFRCSCGPNFKLGSDGKSCYEVDDCTSSPCQHNGTCIDRVNSFICICDPGYTDQQCETDIDECVEKNGGCEDICKNTNGSYECSCEGDKHLDENGFSCIRDDDKVHSIIFWIVVLIASAVIFICTMVLAYRIFIRQREKTEIKLKLVTNPENDDLCCEENNGLIIWDTTVGTKKFGSYYDEQ